MHDFINLEFLLLNRGVFDGPAPIETRCSIQTAATRNAADRATMIFDTSCHVAFEPEGPGMRLMLAKA